MPGPHLRLSVSDLGTSTSFYQGALQPLEYRYIKAKGGSVGIGVHSAEFWLTERSSSDKVSQTRILLSVPDREVVHEFYKAALRAGGRPRFAPKGRGEDGYNAAVLDFDDNIVEVTYQSEASDDEDEPLDHGKVISWRRGRRELLDLVDDDETVITTRSSKSAKGSSSRSSTKPTLRQKSSIEPAVTADDVEEIPRAPSDGISPTQVSPGTSANLMSAFSSVMGDGKAEVTPNGVLGGTIALIATAAICIQTMNAEKDSAHQEAEFNRAMASRDQRTKRRDSKMTNDGQPSPPCTRNARESADMGRRQLAIEASPTKQDDPFVMYRNPTFTTIATTEVEPEYVSLSTSSRPRASLSRAATMPESVTQIERRKEEIVQQPDNSESSDSDAEENQPDRRHRRSSRSSHTSARSARPASHVSKSHASKALQSVMIAESETESNRSRSRSRSRTSSRCVPSSRTSYTSERKAKSSVVSRVKQIFNTPVESSENTGAEESDIDTILPCDSVSQIGGPAANTHRRRSSVASSQLRAKSSKSSVKSHSYSRSHDYDEEIEQDRSHVSADSGGKRSSPRSKRSTTGSTSSRGHRHTRSKEEQRVIRPSEIEEATDDNEERTDDAHEEDRSSSTVTQKKFSSRHAASRYYEEEAVRGSHSYVGSAATMPIRGSDRRTHTASARRPVASYAG